MAAIGALLGLGGLIVFGIGIVTLIHPFNRLRIPNRRIAGGVLGAGLILFIVGVIITPTEDKKSSTTPASANSTNTPANVKLQLSPTAPVAPKDTVTPTGTAAPKDTATPKPTDTPQAPTATPSPLTDEQQFLKSYKDNRGFLPRAVADPTVRWFPDTGILEFRKYEIADSEGAVLTMTSASALVASRAIWTTYPSVQLLQFTIVGDSTNQNTGQKSQDIQAAIMIDRATAAKFDYDGLKGVVLSDNKRLFCASPHHFIVLYVYAALKDKGCLGLPGKNTGPMLFD